MTLQAKLVWGGHYTAKITAGSALNPGDVVLISSTLVGVVAGAHAIPAGEVATVYLDGIFDFASASGTTAAAGAIAEWDDTANLAVDAAGGDQDIGSVFAAKSSGETTMRVVLNHRTA
jgi:predicted RecA/RadA family phage recombinase